jgi:hypothetical protein
MFNMQQMMAKAQTVQRRMEELQEDLAHVEVMGSSGGGLVRVTITCKGNMTSLSIDPSLINATEREMLEDMIKAACNDARTRADQKMAEETQKIMADMGLPAGFKLPF